MCAADARALPFRDGSFDRTVSSLLLHHLTRPAKRAALGEIARVLSKRDGELHVLDWGRAGDPLMRVAFVAV